MDFNFKSKDNFWGHSPLRDDGFSDCCIRDDGLVIAVLESFKYINTPGMTVILCNINSNYIYI